MNTRNAAKINKKIKATTVACIAGILVASCAHDLDCDAVVGPGEALVTLSLSVPGTPVTRMTGTEENAINAIDVLLFKKTADATDDDFYYRAIGTAPVDDGTIDKKKFTARLPLGTYRVVVLANARAALTGITPASIAPAGTSRAALLDALTLSLDNVTDKWEETFDYIPMWGYYKGSGGELSLTIDETTNNIAQAINLTRAIARVDVSIAEKSPDPVPFVLKHVYLYNYSTAGTLAPLVGNGAADGYDSGQWDSNDGKAKAPRVPSGVAETGPLAYAVPSADELAFTGAIYTFEAPLSVEDHVANACLVIGGCYDGGPETYYRVEFVSGTAEPYTYLALLRNHLYNVVIQDVTGHGHPSFDDAYRARPANIRVTVTAWDMVELNETVFNGQEYLSVDRSDVTLYNEGYAKTIEVTTDYRLDDLTVDSWAIENSSTWLDVTPPDYDGAAGQAPQTLTIGVKSGHELGANPERTADFYIVAGNLRKKITVTQKPDPEPSLLIVDEQGNPFSGWLFGPGSGAGIPPAAKTFIVKWLPNTITDVAVSSVPVAAPFVYGTTGGASDLSAVTTVAGTAVATTGPPYCEATIIVQPPANVTDHTLFACVDFTVGDRALQVYFRQDHGVIPVVAAAYAMDGGSKSLGIRSEHPFTIAEKSDPGNVLSSLSTSGLANTSAAGEPVNFTLHDDMTNPTLFERDVELTISSDDGKFPNRNIVLKCTSVQPLSNCYIVKPGSIGILIPVARCNESKLGVQLGTNETFTAHLVWTDNILGVAPASNIKQIATAGTAGSGGYVLVTPGTASGNAVVCIKKAGTILWSWHIWVTDYVPVGTGASGFMDRNLGAATAAKGTAAAFGMFYQWGRKDPLPGSSSTSSFVQVPIYSAANTTASITQVAAPTTSTPPGNLDVAVKNPLTFYTVATADGLDWLTGSGSYYDITRWLPSAKTVYDPCPPGWRVPGVEAWAGMNGTNCTWDDTYDGCNAPEHGGFYPAVGYHDTSGVWYSVSSLAACWSASVHTDFPTAAQALHYIKTTGLEMRVSRARGHGQPVRCVTDEP